MAANFRELLESLINERIATGEDPRDVFEELAREADSIFGRYNLEYQIGLFVKESDDE